MRVSGLLLTMMLAAGTSGAQDYLNCHFAPGWEPSGTRRDYAADNLFEYKDGGAEGYLSFGFVRMQGITCESGADTLDIDVSEMADADSAYGVFAANATPACPLPNSAWVDRCRRQSASFAKGKYYVELVEIAANPDNDHTPALTGLRRTRCWSIWKAG